MVTVRRPTSVETVEGPVIPGDTEMRPGDPVWFRGRLYIVAAVHPPRFPRAVAVNTFQDVLDFEVPTDSRTDSPT